MKKNIFYYVALLCVSLTLSACDDFFEPETDNVLDNDKYIDENNEMFSGYVGIMTRVQAVGDRLIYLTDTRGELLEPTLNAPTELVAIYNYESDLTGNSYADPAGYYDVVIACNDYLAKMIEYKRTNPANLDPVHYDALISSTLRIKVWAYLTIGKIYGKAIWFDDPLQAVPDLSKFPVRDFDGIIDGCREMLEQGYEGVGAGLKVEWWDWLDPYTELGSSQFRAWEIMVPEYFALYGEVCLWDGDYQTTLNTVLGAMNAKFGEGTSQNIAWLRNLRDGSRWSGSMYTSNLPDNEDVVSAILYDYLKNQSNQLLVHFNEDAPNRYMLRPSEAGMARFTDPAFNPVGSGSDSRINGTFNRNAQGHYAIRKFRRSQPYMGDVNVLYYRGADLYFMLIESLNQLGRFEEASALLNKGVDLAFPDGNVTWPGFTQDWTRVTTNGTRSNADLGIRGLFNLADRPLSDDIEANDREILKEMMLEFACEGRIYPAMIRMARRHNDLSFITEWVCPKYPDAGAIEQKILAGGYFLNWDLGELKVE